jgi:hypothetical protein
MAAPNNQGSGTLADAASTIVLGPTRSLGANWIYILAAATGSFRLDLQISVDSDANWVTAKSITDSANNDSTYTRSAEMDQTAPLYFQVLLYNDSGGSIDYIYDARCYNNIQS